MEAIATRKTLISVGIVMTVNQDFALNPHFTRLYQQGDYDSREIKLTDFDNIYSANFPLSNDPRKNLSIIFHPLRIEKNARKPKQ